MTSLTTGVAYTPGLPNQGYSVLYVDTGSQSQVGGTDYVNVALSTYGMSTFRGIKGFVQTTDGSIVVAETPTTSVTTGTLKIVLGAGNNGKRRIYEVWGI